jgi:hypothetical protein
LRNPSQGGRRVGCQLRPVLVGDFGIRTEIDHDQLSAPAASHELFDHAARNNGLAEPDFISEKKAA